MLDINPESTSGEYFKTTTRTRRINETINTAPDGSLKVTFYKSHVFIAVISASSLTAVGVIVIIIVPIIIIIQKRVKRKKRRSLFNATNLQAVSKSIEDYKYGLPGEVEVGLPHIIIQNDTYEITKKESVENIYETLN